MADIGCGISTGSRVRERGWETEAVALVEEARVLSAQEGWQTEDVALAPDARVRSAEEGWLT
jgi:hypothetical protein